MTKTLTFATGESLLIHEQSESDVMSILEMKDYPLNRLAIPNATTIVDIGAHCGATSLLFSKIFPQAKVYSYEPLSVNLALARENLKNPNITLNPFGLGDKEKTVRIYHSPQFGFAASSSQKTRDHSDDFEDVQIKAAHSELAPLGPISILKIDTEGHELPIIQSIRPLLPNVSLLFLEVHSDLHRVFLDALLYEQFTLFFSRSEMAHRYCLAYVNKQALANGSVQVVVAPELLAA